MGEKRMIKLREESKYMTGEQLDRMYVALSKKKYDGLMLPEAALVESNVYQSGRTYNAPISPELV